MASSEIQHRTTQPHGNNNGGEAVHAKANGKFEENTVSGALLLGVAAMVKDSVADLDKEVRNSVEISMVGAAGLGSEDWYANADSANANGDEERPFRTVEDVSYKTLLEFVSKNKDCSAQSYLHYIVPWYVWALDRAESALISALKESRSEFRDAGKRELVETIRKSVISLP